MDLIISDLFKEMYREKESGYGGMNFDIEDYNLEEDEMDRLFIKIKLILNSLNYQYKYYGENEEGRRRLYNFDGLFVGNIISIDWE